MRRPLALAALLLASPAQANQFTMTGVGAEPAVAPPFQAPDTSMCLTPPTTFNHVWWVNPTAAPGGNGSSASPWNSLSTAVAAAGGGDEILLMSGTAAQYGDTLISGVNKGSFVTIAAAPGQTPILDALRISNSSLLELSGFAVQRVVKSTIGIVSVVESGGANITHDIDFDHVAISSADYSIAATWTQAMWAANASPGFTSQRSAPGGMYCVNVTNSHIFNTQFQAAQLFADHSYFLNNELDHASIDFIDYAADNITIRFNHLHDVINLGGGAHIDLMQGFTTAALFHDIWIDSNVGIEQEDPALPFMPLTVVNGGVDSTDEDWERLNITNNVVAMENHAISIGSCHDCLIAGNTTTRGTVSIQQHTNQGTASTNVIVRNNLVVLLTVGDPNATVDHNMIAFGSGTSILFIGGVSTPVSATGSYAGNTIDSGGILSELTAYNDTTTFASDFHLRSAAPARGFGTSAAPVPTVDITGFPRAPAFDVGAYAFH